MTPKALGRFYLVKPPLLIWLSGLSMRLFGISRFGCAFGVAGRHAGGPLPLSGQEGIRGGGATTLLLAIAPQWTFSASVRTCCWRSP
jgi:4-amino-4-deoxy-L-arabinose transferase-like glycosyltransferase